MIALQISEIGPFFNQFLKGSLFDNFLLQEAAITQSVTYSIDGAVNPDFYTSEELEEQGLTGCRYMPFSHIRPICLEMLKGKKKPTYFKFVFLLSPRNQENTITRSGSSFQTSDITGMYLNLIYKNNMLICTTGISYRIFSMDKTLEKEWDRFVTLFFKQNKIPVEQI